MTKSPNKLFASFIILALLLALIPANFTASATVSELFFSEYIEGSSYNKALEIYNGTGGVVDLSTYTLELYSNGASSPSQSTTLSGLLADGDVYVIAHSDADALILAQADATNSIVINFNGDDALVLKNSGVFIDVIGQIGTDPGSEWGSGDASTKDNTIRRKADICVGDINGTDAFDPSFEWVGFAKNTMDGFGAHTANCGDVPPPASDVIINEVDADQVSTDSAEFVELFDGGVGNTDLTGLVMVLFNGSDDASYLAFDLDGLSTGSDGYFVLCGNAVNVANCDLDVSPDTNLIQNGADAVALLVGDAASFPNDTPVTTDNLIDAIVYDTDDSDDAGLLVLLNPGQPQVDERGGGDGTVHSNQRCSNGSGGARNTGTYAQFEPTPGAENTCGAALPDVIINEVDADQVSTDSVEFVELYDGGVGNTDLTGLVLVLFNGSDDASYLAFDLDGLSTDGDGYFVLCGNAGNVANCDLDVSPDTDLIQNGADAVALLVGDAAAFPNDTPVTTDNLIDAIVYDTGDSDDAGLLVLLNPGQPQVDERGGGDGTAHSNQRCPNGTGGLRNTDTYTQLLPTPGSANCEEPPPPVTACGEPYTSIYTVQGSGYSSPLDGTLVDVEGIVTGDFQDGKYGFTIQDALGDGDAATSDGVFVYASSPDVNVGDHVRVTGYVDEYYELTEITGVSGLEVCSTGNAIAATPIYLPVMDMSDLEVYEGMLVTFPQSLYISEYFNFDRYGEIVLSNSRQFQPTAVYEPGSPEAAALAITNQLGRIKLDDGRGSQNPDPALHPNGGIFDLTNLFRGGDVLNNLTGIVDYHYGEYKIQPTQGADYISANPRTVQPYDVGGNLKVASFNVLNYFTTLGSRGADDPLEFQRQREKIFAALAAIDADVVGLIEIENNGAAVQDLVNGLNGLVGPGTYAYIDTGLVGVDEITVAFIYKPAAVSLVGVYAVLDDPAFTDPFGYGEQKSRPALAQTFMNNANGGIFTAAVNHLKSKGSPCGVGDDDPEQGSCNLTRTLAAQALVDWLATDPTGSGDNDFLIIGDINAYDKEDPIDTLLAGGYTDLVYQYIGEYAYSYVYSGLLGYLDHALANQELLPEVTGTTVWRINADEPDILDYDMNYKQDPQDALYEPNAFRSSDHDPVIVGLGVCDEIAPTLEVSVSPDTIWPPNHKYVRVKATVTASDNFDLNPVIRLVSVTSNEPDNGLGDGDTPDDIVIIDDFTFDLRAERSGSGSGRIYTITYEVTDACGNTTMQSATVTVPHSKGKKR